LKTALFLCTGNSARSIMAEAYFNHAGRGRWRAFSAGSKPTGKPNPFALATLAAHGVDAGAPRSKSWNEFSAAGAPPLDLVVTVCDSAAAEECPVFFPSSGQHIERLHWSFPDPAAVEGGDDEKRAAFERIFADIRARIDAFLAR
jgi:arsenate reductase